ncbi:MAG: ATP-grasp domain-containing protein [Ruminococcaceae bacterium]|nr:ATP-grasp domain-containing protein [Oscillospiraceae bacterium]
MKGYILYDKKGYERNSVFAENICSYAASRGVDIQVLIREELCPAMQDSRLVLTFKNGSAVDADFILNRCIDPMFAEFAERSGITLFNSAEVCRICNDKRLTHIYLAGSGIPMADSAFLNKYDLDYSPKSYPAVLKAPDGHGGSEVFFVRSKKELDSFSYTDRLIQTPCEKLGYDLRVYVMDGEILASVLRHSPNDFRSNFSLGGTAELYTLSQDQKDLVYKVIGAMPKGALYVGIDFIFDGDKMLLNEIEDIVGSRMLYTKTSIPVHELLTDCVINKMNKENSNGK